MNFREARVRAYRAVRRLKPYTGKDVERCYACGEANLALTTSNKFMMGGYEIQLPPGVVVVYVACIDCKYCRPRAPMRCESVPAVKRDRQLRVR